MSFGARVINFLFRLIWWFSRGRQTDVAWQRKTFSSLARFIPRRGDTTYIKDDICDIPGEWIIPYHASESRIMYYLHGGAYATCSIDTHRRLIANLAHAARVRAYAIEYTLCPDAAFPVAIDQSVACYLKLLEKGFQPEKIIIAGDSAGGGLALATMLKLRELGIPLPGLAVLLSPWTDVEGIGGTNSSADQRNPINNIALQHFGKMYAGTNDPRNPLISPIYADFTGFPPMLIQASNSELILDDAVRLAEKARAANVDVTLQTWDGLVHVWQVFDHLLPEARAAIAAVGVFVRQKVR